MYVLKGFVTHDLLVNNTVGATAQIGELSSESMTYAREKGSYVSSGIADLTLVTFLSKQDATLVPANTIQLATNEMASDHALQIAQWVYNQTILGQEGTGNVVSADTLLNDMIAKFSTVGTNFQTGQIITDGKYYMPEWVSWDNTQLADSHFKLWFVDDSFQREYDEFEIIIVPPVTTLDDFFQAGSVVDTEVNSRTLTQTMAAIQAAKAGYPETIIVANLYNYIDPLNASHVVPTYWSLVIYGAAGNNIDSINDALINYILANSTHAQADWLKIFPDIFRRTEYMLVPMWDNYGIPNRTLEAGIYSPVANLTSALALISQAIPAYPQAHINSHAAVMGNPYKSLNILSVGGPQNRNNWFNITDVFPDYIDVPTTSLDFNRMSDATKNWCLTLAQMILTAETMDQYSDIPVGMTRTTRDGILYLVYNYQNVHYLVAAKKSFPLPSQPAA